MYWAIQEKTQTGGGEEGGGRGEGGWGYGISRGIKEVACGISRG